MTIYNFWHEISCISVMNYFRAFTDTAGTAEDRTACTSGVSSNEFEVYIFNDAALWTAAQEQ